MEIRYTLRAQKDLETFSREVQRRIVIKMRFYSSQKDSLKFAKRLTNPTEGQFRFRIGDCRLVFDVIAGTIYILKILRRDKAYD